MGSKNKNKTYYNFIIRLYNISDCVWIFKYFTAQIFIYEYIYIPIVIKLQLLTINQVIGIRKMTLTILCRESAL